MLQKKEIQAYLASFMRRQLPRLRHLDAYYRGQHDILRAPRDPLKPDNRLVNNFCRSITDSTVGYFMGSGVRYAAGDDGTASAIAAIAAQNDEHFVNCTLARDLSVTGRAAEILWYDAETGCVRFTPLPPESVIPVWDNSLEPRLRAAIRFYRADGEDAMTVEVYDDKTVTTYRESGGVLTETDCREHFFCEVPIVFYRNNSDMLGDFEPVLSLVDAYNRLQSASVNDFELFADSYLAISGMGATDPEDLARIRRERVILLDGGGDAKWLTKTVNDAYIENLKSRIAKDIYRFSGTVDIAEETLGGTALSGVAIRYRLIHFENRVSVTEQHFRRSLARRWRMICRFLNLSGASLDAEAIRISFSRNLPGLPEEAAEMASKLSGILSRRSLIEQLPFVEDAEAELARLTAEETESQENGGKEHAG